MNNLKVTLYSDKIEDEIKNNQFNLNLSDHILHLKSFIEESKCKKLIKNLNKIKEVDKSTSYTDGLLNDHTDSFFDPELQEVEEIKNEIFKEALKIYAEKVRCFNWSYYGSENLHASEMIIRRYHNQSEFKYHYDDTIEEIFPFWFKRRKTILTCNVYLNGKDEYDGGELHFPSCNKKYRPSVGDIIISPSNWMFYHNVSKITSGIRYAGTFWFYYGSEQKIFKQKTHQKIFSK
jgi:hypothetical protein